MPAARAAPEKAAGMFLENILLHSARYDWRKYKLIGIIKMPLLFGSAGALAVHTMFVCKGQSK